MSTSDNDEKGQKSFQVCPRGKSSFSPFIHMVSTDEWHANSVCTVLQIRDDLRCDWLLDCVLCSTRYYLYCSLTAILPSTSARLLISASRPTSLFISARVRTSSAYAELCQIIPMRTQERFPGFKRGHRVTFEKTTLCGHYLLFRKALYTCMAYFDRVSFHAPGLQRIHLQGVACSRRSGRYSRSSLSVD